MIHGSHSSVTIYYAKLPNLYLSEISKYGRKWKDHPNRQFNPTKNFKEKVKLVRTKKFSMRETSDRVELFDLITKLLWYLISGRSHVGYLYNYPENPIHEIVVPLGMNELIFRDKLSMIVLLWSRRRILRRLKRREIRGRRVMRREWRMTR